MCAETSVVEVFIVTVVFLCGVTEERLGWNALAVNLDHEVLMVWSA